MINMILNNSTTKSTLYFIGIMLLFRGIWGFLGLYIFPKDLKIRFSLAIILGILFVLMSNLLYKK